jgi:hypothetical protein
MTDWVVWHPVHVTRTVFTVEFCAAEEDEPVALAPFLTSSR